MDETTTDAVACGWSPGLRRDAEWVYRASSISLSPGAQRLPLVSQPERRQAISRMACRTSAWQRCLYDVPQAGKQPQRTVITDGLYGRSLARIGRRRHRQRALSRGSDDGHHRRQKMRTRCAESNCRCARVRIVESLTREGRLLAFVDAGSGAPPILLIHDLGFDHRSLRRHLAHFRRQHRVVAVDLRGHGKSDGPLAGHTVTDLAEDLDWLCWELGLYRPAALGQGVGGLIAVELAARHPDLLSAVLAIDAPVLSGEVPRDDRAADLGAADVGSTPSFTASWGLAQEWDEAKALALCRVPILLIVTQRKNADVNRVLLPPGVSAKALRGRRLRPQEAAKRVNALIDAFLSRLSGSGANPRLQPL